RRWSRGRHGAPALRRRLQRVSGRRVDGVRVPPPGRCIEDDPPAARRRSGPARRPADGRRSGSLCVARLRAAAGVLVAGRRHVARQRREYMSLTQYYTATMLDGFIADPNDSLEWLFTR